MREEKKKNHVESIKWNTLSVDLVKVHVFEYRKQNPPVEHQIGQIYLPEESTCRKSLETSYIRILTNVENKNPNSCYFYFKLKEFFKKKSYVNPLKKKKTAE